MGRIIPTSKGKWNHLPDPFSGDCCGYSWTWRESTGHWTVYTVPIRGGLEIVFRSAWYLQMSSLGVFRWRKCGPIVCAEVSGPCRAAHTKRGKLGPVWRKAEDTDSHSAGWGLCRLCALFSQQAKQNWEMLNLMVTQPHIHRAGAGGTGHAGSGSGGGTGYDPREPHSVNRGQYPKQPVGHPSW